MKTFAKPNYSKGQVCPLCKTASNGEIILVPIVETLDGNLAEVVQIHTACLQEQMVWREAYNILYANPKN